MLPIIMNIADDGDRNFVEEIYVTYEKKLYLISMGYLHNKEDSEDCVHDTIELVIKHIDNFKVAQSSGYLGKLIIVVCRNCAKNIQKVNYRRYKREQGFVKYNQEEGKYEEFETIDDNSYVEKIYISEQNCDLLKNLINKLDDKYRDVILLKSLGLGTKAIAEIMKISEALVRKRYSRAKKQLLEMGGKDLYVE